MRLARAFERTLFEILGSRELLSLAVLSVLLYAFYYPAPYSQQQPQALPMLVVDLDQTPLTRGVVRALGEVEAIRLVGQPESLAAAREAIRARRAEGVLYLSRGFTDSLITGRPGAGAALILDASYFVRAEGMAKALGEVIADRAEAVIGQVAPGAASGVPIVAQPLFNTTTGYRDYVFPAIANIILQQTLLFTAARLIAERRRRGVWQGGAAEAIGTWLACVLIGLLGQAFFFGFAYWLQDVPRGGNMPGLLIAMPLFAAAVAALGLTLGTWFRSGDDALKLLIPTSVPLVFLAGFAWPLDQMPGWLATLAWASPATAAMHLFVRFNQMGASLAEARGPMMAMAALALAYGAAWLWRSRARG